MFQRKGSRVSVACARCRAKHVRCDAIKPTCSRCQQEQYDCSYPSSKRGGLNRASLAAFKARKTSQEDDLAEPDVIHPCASSINSSEFRLFLDDRENYIAKTVSAKSSFNFNSGKINEDTFVQLFFQYFHRYHPCVLPASRIQLYFDNPSFHDQLLPVLAVIRLIGSIYAQSSFAETLMEEAENALVMALQNTPQNPFIAQALLLYSISLYWSNEETKSRNKMDLALRIALEIGMNCRSFSVSAAPSDPLLQECFRRTWWQIYITDASYAAIQRSPTFAANNVACDVDLPCSEDNYEHGTIAQPLTLAEFESREFDEEDKPYSSFAYLIGIVRGIAQITSTVALESSNCPGSDIVTAIDAVVDGWLLLLPESKQVLNSSGEIDELLSFAKMWMHATTIWCHRNLSDIAHNSLEDLSSCSDPAPKSNPPNRLKQMHTRRCLSAIQEQIKLLTLPKKPFCHSPFIICMVVVGALPYLSACTGLLQGSELVFARHQIRFIIGCLKSIGSIWKRGDMQTRELKAIGKEIIFGALPAAYERQNETLVSDASKENAYELYYTSEPLFDVDVLSLLAEESEYGELWPIINP